MNDVHERFCHLEISRMRLGRALDTFRQVQEYRNHPLAKAAFAYGVVEYAASFTTSKGKHKKYWLKEGLVPTNFVDLHQRLLDARNQLLAHHDVRVLEPSVTATKWEGDCLTSLSMKGLDGTEEMGNLDEIIGLVRATIDNAIREREKLKFQLTDASG